MKDVTFCGNGFAELQSDEIESINGGAAPKLPLGFTWKDVFLICVDNINDLKNGLVDGWSYPDKK